MDVNKLILSKLGSSANHCECGFGLNTCFPSGRNFTFVEPNPLFYTRALELYPKAKIYHAAIVANIATPTVAIQLAGEDTHLASVRDCPVFHRGFSPGNLIEVPAITFDLIDTGFDSVILDMEGAEWFALMNMKSRPRILMIETHSSKTSYQNPFIGEIQQWTADNGYEEIYRGVSNTIWIR